MTNLYRADHRNAKKFKKKETKAIAVRNSPEAYINLHHSPFSFKMLINNLTNNLA